LPRGSERRRLAPHENRVAVAEPEVVVLHELDVEAPSGDEFADARPRVADDDDDALHARASERRHGPLEEGDAGDAGERLGNPSETRARSRREDDADGHLEERLRRTTSDLLERGKLALRLRDALDGRHSSFWRFLQVNNGSRRLTGETCVIVRPLLRGRRGGSPRTSASRRPFA
jgi:hypothetical protein